MEEDSDSPEIGYVQLAELNYDWLRWIDGVPFGYQRPLEEPNVAKFAAAFDAHLIGVIVVNRRADGSLWVLDGQTRCAVLAKVGHSIVLATIYNGLSPADEAQTYWHLNVARKPLNQWNRFGARGSSGDHVVAAIVSLCAEYHFRIGTADRSLNSIAAVNTLERLYGWPDGPRLLRLTLDRVRTIWATHVTSRDGIFIEGLAKFIFTWDGSFAETQGECIDWSRFNARFSKVSANEVARAAKTLRIEGGLELNSSTYAVAFRDEYNGKSNFSRRLTGRVAMPRRNATTMRAPVRPAR